MTCRDVRRTGIYELPIHFVRKEIEVVFLDKVSDPVHLRTGVKVSGRVVRVADQDRFGPFCYKFLEFLHRRQGKTRLYRRCDTFDHRTGRHGKRHIIGVRRLGYNNLIPRIKAGQEGEKHRFRASACHDHIVRSEIDVVS